MEDKQHLTDRQIQQVTALLRELEPGYLPEPIFFELSRLMVVPVVELVPLRINNQGTEVLLLDRGDDDPYWPGTVHVPGTVFMATDTTGNLKDALQRLLEGELKGVRINGGPQFVRAVFHQTRRGKQLANVHFVELAEKPEVGAFYSVDELPENTMDHQVGFIKDAARVFWAKKTTEGSATITP